MQLCIVVVECHSLNHSFDLDAMMGRVLIYCPIDERYWKMGMN